jgi:hypothetical protein
MSQLPMCTDNFTSDVMDDHNKVTVKARTKAFKRKKHAVRRIIFNLLNLLVGRESSINNL